MVSWLGWCEVESSAVAAMAFRFGVLILALVICLNFNSVESDDGECCLQFQIFCCFFCVCLYSLKWNFLPNFVGREKENITMLKVELWLCGS